jgi:hypothetical protein
VTPTATDIAEGERGCTGYPRVGCEIDFSTLTSNFGVAALNTYGEYPRTWDLENSVEIQHELFPEHFSGRELLPGQLPQPDDQHQPAMELADYSPYTWYNPITGAPFTVFARTAAASVRRPTSSTRSILNGASNIRPSAWRSAPVSKAAARSWRRRILARAGEELHRAGRPELQLDHTAPTVAVAQSFTGVGLCDDFANDIPFQSSFKARARSR